jgi:S-DNA-T family DNA segregation ATPase FtsK/SpoIIIE
MARVIGGYFNVVSIPIEYEAPGEDYDEELPELTAMSDAYLLTTEQSFSAPVVRDEVEKHDIASPRMHEEEQFQLPNKSIFIGVKDEFNHAKQMKELKALAQVLEEKLCCFGVSGSVLSIKFGPVVTLFEYQPDIDSKISKIIALEDDLALALQALSIRIIAPIPGRSVVGFEVSNPHRKSVLLADVVQSASYEKFVGGIPLILGQDTVGNNVVVDLAKMPHLLVAGSTGSGKSVALNAMLISILCARTPDEVRLILIDPKRLEFVPYADIAHLLFPIITESKDAVSALGWVVHEMDVRYKRMAEKGARNCADYNKIVTRAEQIPFIVVIIDELSDLMMTAGREIEGLIIRITQMARAAGIHMIVATQRPSVDVITGLIKVNFPSRISFRVTSKIDSRTILDCGGADKLLGRGDMLFLDSTDSTLKRVHGAYVTDDEIKKVADAIRQQQSPLYLDLEPHIANVGGDIGQEDEALYSEILKFLKEIDEISISLLQRKFRIGYNRSARIIEILEARGLVASSESGKTRKVIR